MMLLAGVGFVALAFHLRERQIAQLVSVRGGASLATLRRRERYRGSRKARVARRRIRDASRLVSGLVRRPSGWSWARPIPSPWPFLSPGALR